MTTVLEEVIVDLSRERTEAELCPERNGIDSRIAEYFDVSVIAGRRLYLLCFGKEASDITVGLAVMSMKDRTSALISDLLALKAHANHYGQFPFQIVCRGSWTSIERCVHYPCLKSAGDHDESTIELVPGSGYWPADTRFLMVDK
jgi:hypothetical protein